MKLPSYEYLIDQSPLHNNNESYKDFVNIRSRQEGFSGFLKQVGSLIRLLNLYNSQKDSICGSSVLIMKSPNKVHNELNISLSFSLMHVISGDVRFVWVIRTTEKPFLFMKTEFKEKSFNGFLFRK